MPIKKLTLRFVPWNEYIVQVELPYFPEHKIIF
jgi:hypothetical protein